VTQGKKCDKKIEVFSLRRMRKINIKDAWNHSQITMALQNFVDMENETESMSE
jgi:hypothetical protein